MNVQLKIARAENDRIVVQELVKLLTHPVYSVLFSFIVIELLQSAQVNERPLMGTVAGSVLEGALVANGVLASLSKGGTLEALLPVLLKS